MTWVGAPASRVWLSPLLPNPFEPIVEIYFLSNKLLALSWISALRSPAKAKR